MMPVSFLIDGDKEKVLNNKEITVEIGISV
ncbi:MAG: hypothetical protein K0S25_1423 [Bacillus sp. (in: firmicutes)]|jgi:hypothetical protein|nr:hypothetical protein [Bacillus sp. (in: firmicutes)]